MNFKLIEKKVECLGTKSFFFKSEKPFTWLPGQYIYLKLKLNYPDERGDLRDFTISSSQTEDDLVRITTRVRQSSGYKKTLDEIKIGDFVEANGPHGFFIFDPIVNKGNNIFLAGGIGITPFRSFIKSNIDNNLSIPMHLIYSNTNENEITFKEELKKIENKYNFFKLDSFITSKEGRLNETKLNKIISKKALLKSNFWIVGPPAFVSAMEGILEKLGVSSDKIRIEKFTGY